jgi:hypothetical protein
MRDKHEKPTAADTKTPTLDESDIVTERAVSRRTAMLAIGTVTVSATSAVGAALTGCIVRTQPAYQQQPVYVQQGQPQAVYVQQGGYQRAYSGVTDGDQGPYADAAGYGRGQYRGVQTGLTDSDNGTGGIQDPAGQGRGHHGQPGWQSGMTDSDGGAYADPAGNGRGRGQSGNSGLTDSDSGSYADPAGRGRGRWR